MSRKERIRLTVMMGVKKKELRLVQAAQLIGVSYRQSKRIWQRYQVDGDAGLVHRLRAGPARGANRPRCARRPWPATRKNATRILARH